MQLKMTPEMHADLNKVLLDASGFASPSAGSKFNLNNLIRAFISHCLANPPSPGQVAQAIEEFGLSRGRPTKDE